MRLIFLWGGHSAVLDKIKVFFANQKLKWIARFAYYLLILLLLFFMYGFNDANAGTYIYNDF
ncbi:teichoic acid D-Ala incorporation-associated protein DltX [Bacillus sp. BRMEA1]|nr:teichoic acid D-Ala incorporation-associated protein DltX [Neobacillus endophyticus]